MKSFIRGLTVTFVASLMTILIANRNSARAQAGGEIAAVPLATASPTDVIGTWVGTNTLCTGCALTLDVTRQNGASFGGTFTIETGMDTPSGAANGKLKGASVKMIFHATMNTNHPCTAKATATLTNPTTMDGTFTVVKNAHCRGRGGFHIVKM